MMEDITELRAEIERLRDLCHENDIDPDLIEHEPPPQLYGPPTLLMHITAVTVRQLFDRLLVDLTKPTPLDIFADENSGRLPLRIRLPNDFTVTR